MKFCKFYLFIVTGVVLAGLCGCENGCLKGQGKTTEQRRALAPFTGIKVYGWTDVILEKGSVPEATIVVGENLVNNVVLENETTSGFLVIRNNNQCHWSRAGGQPLVKIKYQTLSQIEQWGFGNISSLDTLSGTSLNVRVSGNGDVNLLVNLDSFDCSMLELGDLTVAGRSTRSNLFSHNVGFFKGRNFVTSHCTARTRDEGEFEVHVSDSLFATVESTGNIRYFGNPTFVEANVTGLGKVEAGN
ncbi:hypothetical protein BKI52_30665 [marine bacterium AO1-C]|nr:hypothetical protein BKI52_30665 [marine bacterium AO1-C]